MRSLFVSFTMALVQVLLDCTIPNRICQRDMPKVQSTSNNRSKVSKTITLYTSLDEIHTCNAFGVVNELILSVLLAMAMIDGFVKFIHPAVRKIVPN